MTIQQNSAAPGEAPKKKNCFLWGCLIVFLLIMVTVCCLGTLVFMPLFTDFDPLGLDLRNRIEQVFPWQEFIQDPSIIPGLPELLNGTSDPLMETDPSLPMPTPGALAPTRPAEEARAIPLSTYTASDFPATFSYPAGWEIEVEEYGVTFYDPVSYTYLAVGEDLVEPGTTAKQVSQDVIDSLQEDSEEGSFKVFESTPWDVPTGDDAHLNAYEWTDQDGYYQWAFHLETISGESNVYFFLSGEDPDDAPVYGELIEIIAASFSR